MASIKSIGILFALTACAGVFGTGCAVADDGEEIAESEDELVSPKLEIIAPVGHSQHKIRKPAVLPAVSKDGTKVAFLYENYLGESDWNEFTFKMLDTGNGPDKILKLTDLTFPKEGPVTSKIVGATAANPGGNVAVANKLLANRTWVKMYANDAALLKNGQPSDAVMSNGYIVHFAPGAANREARMRITLAGQVGLDIPLPNEFKPSKKVYTGKFDNGEEYSHECTYEPHLATAAVAPIKRVAFITVAQWTSDGCEKPELHHAVRF